MPDYTFEELHRGPRSSWINRSSALAGGRLAPCYLVIHLSMQVSSWIAFVVANGAWSACAFASGAIIMARRCSLARSMLRRTLPTTRASAPPLSQGLTSAARALTDALAKSY